MPPASDNNDGIMDRMAKRLFASQDSPFTAFADRQRIERVEQCRQLERILKACQSANDAQVAGNEFDTNSSEEVEFQPSRSGARIARFFKWNGPDEQNGTQEVDSGRISVLSEAAASVYEDSDTSDGQMKQPVPRKKSNKRSFSTNCAIETHELWACRALALGCGNHVGDLRRCWSDANSPNQKTAAAVGNEITFENGNENSCRHIQLNMAKCVNKNAAELAERVQAAKDQ
ncbi:hypothetical protein ACHAXR_004402 [Thalassiosira sp. AJA248-18]